MYENQKDLTKDIEKAAKLCNISVRNIEHGSYDSTIIDRYENAYANLNEAKLIIEKAIDAIKDEAEFIMKEQEKRGVY